jgi:hypothetical protein
MMFKRALCASTLAAGVGLAGLLGVGLSTASADPGPGCNAPGKPPCGQDWHNNNNQWNNGPGNNNGPRNDNQWNNGPGNNNQWNNNQWNNGPGQGPVDWNNRGIDQGRQDHQPFNWNGQQVNPIQAANGQGWGFWFLGMWIPL